MSCCLFAGIKTLLVSHPLRLLTNHQIVKWTHLQKWMNHFLHLRCTSYQVKHFQPAWLKWPGSTVLFQIFHFAFRWMSNGARCQSVPYSLAIQPSATSSVLLLFTWNCLLHPKSAVLTRCLPPLRVCPLFKHVVVPWMPHFSLKLNIISSITYSFQ